MLIWGGVFAKGAQVGIAVARSGIAQHFVICFVFLDDIDHVLKHAGLTRPLRHGLGWPSGSRGKAGLGQQRVTQIGQGGLGVLGELLFYRYGNEGERAREIGGVVLRPAPLVRHALVQAFDIRHANLFAGGIIDDGARKPAGGNQAQ